MRKTRAIKAGAFLLAVFCLAAATGFFFDGETFALPSNEVETTYYSNGSYSTQIGYSILFCNGSRYSEGTTSIYKQVYSTPCW